MNENEISSLLKKAREDRHLTQKEAAEKVSYSPQTISLWESNKVSIKLDFLFGYLDALGIDPVSFLDGEIVETDNPYHLDNAVLLAFVKKRAKERKADDSSLMECLGISKPTLNKIFSGENVLSISQFYALSRFLSFSVREPFVKTKDMEPVAQIKKQRSYRKIWIASACLSLLLVVSAGVTIGVNMTKRTNQNIADDVSASEDISEKVSSDQVYPNGLKEETPEIYVDYATRKLCGFDVGSDYRIACNRIVPSKEEINIIPSWYDVPLEIRKLKRDEAYEDSDAQRIFIKSANFVNYFPGDKDGILFANDEDVSLNDRIDYYVNSIAESDRENYKVTSEELSLLKANLYVDIPYISDTYFNRSFPMAENAVDVNYEMKTDADGTTYVWITGVKDVSQKTVVIEKSYQGISDIRIASKAFAKECNPNLSSVIFKSKPHYLGTEIFSGLYLTYLDFGLEDDRSYDIDMDIFPVDITEYGILHTVKRSAVFEGFKGADYARLPLPNVPNLSSMYFYSWFGLSGPDRDFKGFQSVMFPQDTSSMKKSYFFVSYILNNMKVRSLHIPKSIRFRPDYDRDLYLRAIRFEHGYSDKSENYDKELHDTNGKYLDCMALEYYLKDDVDEDTTYTKSCFKGCLSLRGVINYDVSSIGEESFHSCRLPEEIAFGKPSLIKTNAFSGNYGLKEIHIYSNEEVPSLTIRTNAFVYDDAYLEEHQISKIVFHGYGTEDDHPKLILEDNYKSKEIKAEFVS